jgi:phage gp36-like protein
MNQPQASAANTAITPRFPTYYYCDPGDIQRRLTIAGVKDRTQDYGPGGIFAEGGVVEDCIFDASEIINFYCFSLYRPEDMVTSAWINRRATDIACYLLEARRGNIPSGIITTIYKQAIEWLESVHRSIYEIPGIPIRATQAPAWSNVRIDQRYPTFRVRVERSISQQSPTPYRQSVDWSSEYDYSV